MKLYAFLCALALFGCSTQEKKTPIAILTPISHPSLEQIEKGFKETIETESPGKYRFVTYNAQGNKTLMRSEVDEIIQKGYLLVFTIATMPTQMATEVFAKKGLNTPIVFTCVNDPSGLQGHVTGVKELVDFPKEIEYLLKYKPNLKTLMLVYNPREPGLVKDQAMISEMLKEKSIQLITVEVFQANEFQLKVTPMLGKADAMLILKDNTVANGLDALIKICNQHHIPLMASDLDSPDRGAAFGYGVYEREFGVEGARKALQILEYHVAPEDIPITSITGFNLKINHEAAKLQGIKDLS